MLSNNVNLSAPVRQIKAKVEFNNGSTNALNFSYDGDLVSLQIDRVGNTKFFGFGVSQKANIKVRDIERKYSITTAHSCKVLFDDTAALPSFYVTEVNRDENTNQLSITAYDALDKAAAHTTSEISLTSYTIGEFAAACAAILGLPGALYSGESFNLYFDGGANFDGAESLREALDDVAEATQTIYYINENNYLVFKRLDKDGAPALTIGKSDYIQLDSKTNRRLSAITSATELGDNLTAQLDISGTTQYIRDNAFWDLREDRAQLVEAALAATGGLTINQFNCDWRGNYLVEIGDKIGFVTKDNATVASYLLNDTITYTGAYSQATQWEFTDSEESATNATTLGEALYQTFAKVDKANKEIEIVASEVSANKENISALQLNTNSINASVTSLTNALNDGLENTNENISALTNRVNAAITAEELKIEVTKQIATGVNSVETATGFTFNETGLTVAKSGSDISTTITEDGMQIAKGSTEVLSASNEGVKAIDLHAATYLIIGKNSRFEDYGGNRTGCFWIGG